MTVLETKRLILRPWRESVALVVFIDIRKILYRFSQKWYYCFGLCEMNHYETFKSRGIKTISLVALAIGAIYLFFVYYRTI